MTNFILGGAYLEFVMANFISRSTYLGVYDG